MHPNKIVNIPTTTQNHSEKNCDIEEAWRTHTTTRTAAATEAMQFQDQEGLCKDQPTGLVTLLTFQNPNRVHVPNLSDDGL